MSYTNFAAKYHNKGADGRDCVFYEKLDGKWMWDDYSCDNQEFAVCETKPKPAAGSGSGSGNSGSGNSGSGNTGSSGSTGDFKFLRINFNSNTSITLATPNALLRADLTGHLQNTANYKSRTGSSGQASV